MITAAQLTKICPAIKGQLAINISSALDTVCPSYGINSADIFHEFIANLLVECAEFTKLEENLNYSVKGLISTFKRHRISIEDANKYGRIDNIKGVSKFRPANKEMIGNIIYGGEWGRINLGNILIGDGYSFRGSGPIQMTGRGIISQFTKYYNEKFGTNYIVEEMVELLRKNLIISIHSACWFFAIAKKLIDEAISDEMNEIVKRINGGFNGLDERLRYYERAKSVIV